MDDVQDPTTGSGRDVEAPADERQFDPAVEPPSVAAVEALAAASGVPPEEVRPRLTTVLDADALDALFRPRHDGTSRGGGSVAFATAGWGVEVDADEGVVRVYGVDEGRFGAGEGRSTGSGA